MTFKKKKKKKYFKTASILRQLQANVSPLEEVRLLGSVCVFGGGAVNYFLTLLVEDFSFSNRSNSSDCNYNCVSKRHTGLAMVSPGSKLLCFLLLLLLSFIVR